jgi:hypothetical protein
MGGLRKLYYIDSDDFSSVTLIDDNLYVLSLEGEAEINEIEFSADSGKISETSEMSDNGLIYNFEASCRIPKCGPENINLFGELRLRQLLILAEDNNGNFWLSGAPGTYFTIMLSSDTGQNTQDLNARQLKITAGLMDSSVFVQSPFLID